MVKNDPMVKKPEQHPQRRILGRRMARVLSREELQHAQGECGCGGGTITLISPPDSDAAAP